MIFAFSIPIIFWASCSGDSATFVPECHIVKCKQSQQMRNVNKRFSVVCLPDTRP